MDDFPPLTHFHIRTYGLLIHRSHVLISHEYLRSFAFTKFPGGGLQLGEKPTECLEREFKEELNLAINVGELFYTPDFVVRNHFRKEEQVVVLYYAVHSENEKSLKTLNLGEKKLQSLKETNQVWHEWVFISDLKPDYLTFPADKAVAEKLQSTKKG